MKCREVWRDRGGAARGAVACGLVQYPDTWRGWRVPDLWEVGEQNGHARPREGQVWGERGGEVGLGVGARGAEVVPRGTSPQPARRDVDVEAGLAPEAGGWENVCSTPCAHSDSSPVGGMYVGAFLV